MPTFEALPEFMRDYAQLDAQQRDQFRAARRKFVADLQRGRGFRQSVRVKGVRRQPGVFEMTWAPDGRATFSYGTPVRGNEPHIIWRRIGTHAILSEP